MHTAPCISIILSNEPLLALEAYRFPLVEMGKLVSTLEWTYLTIEPDLMNNADSVLETRRVLPDRNLKNLTKQLRFPITNFH